MTENGKTVWCCLWMKRWETCVEPIGGVGVGRGCGARRDALG